MSRRGSYDLHDIALPEPPAHVHMVGIGGVGVSGLARMLARRGYTVSGSDISDSPIVRDLRSEGIPVAIGHAAENIGDADLVVITAALKPDNPELVEAERRGIRVVKRAAVLGLLANPARSLAVAGSHGKSTTSGMAALALDRAGVEPSFAVGATVRELGTNARLSDGPHIVVEADEYDYSFLWLRPRVAIITNIEHDHPDIFADLDQILDAFARFADGIVPDGMLVLAAEDPGCRALLERIGRDVFAPKIVTFGESAGDWRLNTGADVPTAVSPSGQVFELRLSVPGRHNLLNALAVLASAEGLGVAPGDLLVGLAEFGGVSRRFEVCRDDQFTVVSDYAHHPTEIAATIAAARERYRDRRIVAVFQPHTYSRTRALLDEFAHALDAADAVVLADIYRAREIDSLGVSSADIAARMMIAPQLASDPAESAQVVRDMLRSGDVVLVMGAGDIYQAAEALADTDTSLN
ncbi:MAG: UDP-N-acetylmuramate--L-alanine ligase [Thermomicrobiales bacterium]|nr:UDP-N-acetylmuramate--L-alanine ligase [Thermomicrobiales bacterium]